MITIRQETIDRLIEQGRSKAPLEACGYLAGTGGLVERHFPMANTDKSEYHFTLDPEEQFKVFNETRKMGFEILAVYHTHPASPARPSEEDLKLAYDPDMVYMIISLLEKECEVKAFKIRNGKAYEEVVAVKN